MTVHAMGVLVAIAITGDALAEATQAVGHRINQRSKVRIITLVKPQRKQPHAMSANAKRSVHFSRTARFVKS